MIYKILTSEQWSVLEKEGETVGAPIDVQDGFVHFSTADQVEGTLALYFAKQENLVLAAVDSDTVGSALRWESSRDGQDFPHLYSKLRRVDVAWAETLKLDEDGKHILPTRMNC